MDRRRAKVERKLAMRQMEQAADLKGNRSASGLIEAGLTRTDLSRAGLTGMGDKRTRVEAVVETLATLRGKGESLAEVAHDARNMVTALGLYCDLLDEQGVLAAPFLHYADELRLVATASRRLVEKLLTLDASRLPAGEPSMASRDSAAGSDAAFPVSARPLRSQRWELMPALPVDNLAGELLANRNLLAALAGPSIALTIDIEGGSLAVQLTGEDLTRILVNLVKNAAEAMPAGARIEIGLRERPAAAGDAPWLALTVEDNGPGIPQGALDEVFAAGFTTRSGCGSVQGSSNSDAIDQGDWSAGHRGLGLSITRSIVEAAGGTIHAANRARAGARFEILLPVNCS
jgi:signal transduction histidine kinase